MSEPVENLYGVLEVNPNASVEEIASAFERIMAYLDVNSMAMYAMLEDDDQTHEQRDRVREAHRVLSDPALRAEYDRERTQVPGGYPSVLVPSGDSGSNTTYGHVDRPAGHDTAVTTEMPQSSGGADQTPVSDALASGGASVASTGGGDSDTPPDTRPADGASAAGAGTEPVGPEEAPNAGDIEDDSSPADSSPAASGPAASSPADSSPAASSPADSSPADSGPADSGPGEDPPPVTMTSPALAGPKILPIEAHDSPRGPPRVSGRRLLTQGELPDISGDSELSGVIFKRLRESAGASLRDVAKITKISKTYLRAIEENDFSALPAVVYTRGFVRQYAQVLGLDPGDAADGFMRVYDRYTNEQGS